MRYPAFVEVKVDGEFQFIHLVAEDYGKSFCVNKYGNAKNGFPALNVLVDKFDRHTAVLLGELYYKDGKAGQFYDMQANQDDTSGLQLAVFDCLMVDNVDLRGQSLLDRKEMINEIGLQLWTVPVCIAENRVDVDMMYSENLVDGWEGIVVKPIDSTLVLGPCIWVKMKHKDQTDYIVSFIDPTKERIEVSVPIANTPRIVFVGVKAPNRYKRHIRIGDMVTIEHQGVLASGSLRHPVLIAKKEWK